MNECQLYNELTNLVKNDTEALRQIGELRDRLTEVLSDLNQRMVALEIKVADLEKEPE